MFACVLFIFFWSFFGVIDLTHRFIKMDYFNKLLGNRPAQVPIQPDDGKSISSIFV